MNGESPHSKRREIRPATAATGRAWVLAGSLALNAAAVVWLLRAGAQPAVFQARAASQAAGPQEMGRDRATNAVRGARAPWAEAPFNWSNIESSDYRQYVANLRAGGCPEQIIRDIIIADLNQAYAARRAAIWKLAVPAYWQKPKNDSPGPGQLKQLMALDREKTEIAKELLGFQPSGQALIDTVYLQLHGSEEQLLFLPEAKRAAALAALSEAGLEEKEAKLHASNPNGDTERELFDYKLKVLASVLSPRDLEEFRLRGSPSAQGLRTELQFFDCTPEEYKALLEARERKTGGRNAPSDLLNRAAATEDVRQLLGDDRAKEFERVTDLFYITARVALENEGLPAGAAERAWQISRDARTAADQVAGDSSLPADERKRRIQALEDQAESQLIQALGQKAARPVCGNLRPMLSVTAQNVRP